MTSSDMSDTCVPEDGSDWSELSELSSSEEEEDEERSEGEGWGSDADEPPTKRTKTHRTLPTWGPEAQKAFMRGEHSLSATDPRALTTKRRQRCTSFLRSALSVIASRVSSWPAAT